MNTDGTNVSSATAKADIGGPENLLRTQWIRLEIVVETHEIKIVDRQSLQEFERLLGFKINGNVVRLPHDVYKKHAAAINVIQMSAALRLKR